jgi:hypothetical protein
MAIFVYIEGSYDRERRHTTLGKLSPADYESRPLQCARLTNVYVKPGQAYGRDIHVSLIVQIMVLWLRS